MHLDHELLGASLERLSAFLADGTAPPESPDFAAKLYQLATMLLENPAAQATVKELLVERSSEGAVGLSEWWQARLQRVFADTDARLAEFRSVINKAPANARSQQAREAVEFFDKAWGEFRGTWRPAPFQHLTNDDVLAHFGSPDRIGKTTPEFLSQWVQTLLGADNSMGDAFRRIGATEVHQSFQRIINEQSELARDAISDFEFLRAVRGILSIADLVGQLTRFTAAVNETKQIEGNTEIVQGPRQTSRWLGERRAHIYSLVQEVVARLGWRRARRQVLSRARTYFEHFGKQDLLNIFAAEFSRPDGERHQFEKILQDEYDKFVFREGLFPLTHFHAASGIVDTFVPNDSGLFGLARESRQPPLLVELKQVIDKDEQVSKAEVHAAVAQALTQVELYRKHVASNYAWAGTDTFAVVFYNGPKRYTDERHEVLLVYLGSATPSDKSYPLQSS